MPTTMGGGYQEAEPKTEKTRRTIVLPDFALDALRNHCERQEEIKRKAGEFWQKHDYVFCTQFAHMHPGHDNLEGFKRLLKWAGLSDVLFHDLRHGASTLLRGMGVLPKVVQELQGHKQISMTVDLYSTCFLRCKRRL